jgi:hypothetical protein
VYAEALGKPYKVSQRRPEKRSEKANVIMQAPLPGRVLPLGAKIVFRTCSPLLREKNTSFFFRCDGENLRKKARCQSVFEGSKVSATALLKSLAWSSWSNHNMPILYILPLSCYSSVRNFVFRTSYPHFFDGCIMFEEIAGSAVWSLLLEIFVSILIFFFLDYLSSKIWRRIHKH